jgi:hypothetical protein
VPRHINNLLLVNTLKICKRRLKMKETKYQNIFVDGTDIYKKEKNGNYHKLCQWVDNVGYYQVSFRINGKKKYARVHRIIAETMIPNPNNYRQVNHIDGNKLNNELSNLEWCNNSYNTQEAYNNGLYHSKNRSHKIVAINKNTNERLEFKSIRSCAEELNLNRKTITSILKTQKDNNYPYNFEYLED